MSNKPLITLSPLEKMNRMRAIRSFSYALTSAGICILALFPDSPIYNLLKENIAPWFPILLTFFLLNFSAFFLARGMSFWGASKSKWVANFNQKKKSSQMSNVSFENEEDAITHGCICKTPIGRLGSFKIYEFISLNGFNYHFEGLKKKINVVPDESLNNDLKNDKKNKESDNLKNNPDENALYIGPLVYKKVKMD